ncbi:MAG: hypothetical protein RJA59_286 [Pseudomonadota bacterium]|jgi:hypothetical protein
MNIVAGGVEHAVSFTLLDMRDLGKAGVMARLRKLGEVEEWERMDAMAAFISACVRRAGGKMTADELLLVVKPEEVKDLYAAIPTLLGVKEDEATDPNAPSPGTTAT